MSKTSWLPDSTIKKQIQCHDSFDISYTPSTERTFVTVK